MGSSETFQFPCEGILYNNSGNPLFVNLKVSSTVVYDHISKTVKPKTEKRLNTSAVSPITGCVS